LGFRTRVEVIIPQVPVSRVSEDSPFYIKPMPRPDKILYLLHGLSDDATAWVRHTTIGEYALQRGYIVIMPEVQRSFYTDMRHGSLYFTYITQELPSICEELFNIKHTRENTFVAGLSMGGYGAVKCGLARPDLYAACAGFSGALDMQGLLENVSANGWFNELYAIVGRGAPWPEDSDLFALAEKMARLPKIEQTRVLLTCGDDDYLLENSIRMHKHLTKLPIVHEYKQWAGAHDWKFWEECLPIAFDFFDIDRRNGDA
jgi:S-formylglutathione hydrolase FrmB